MGKHIIPAVLFAMAAIFSLLAWSLWSQREAPPVAPISPASTEPEVAAVAKTHTIRETGQRAIYDCHEHIQSVEEAPLFLAAMDKCGVKMVTLMGSSRSTMTMNPKDDFLDYHENNLEILEIQRRYPDRFLAFPTLDPKDPQKLEKLEQYVKDGARGLKLYLGHGWSFKEGEKEEFVFHTMALDDPQMEPVYAYCEQTQLPISFHVNSQKYFSEFERVLSRHPNMIVIAPHFVLLSRYDNGSIYKLMGLLEQFPNLYTDISFGQMNVVKKGEGFTRLSKRPELYREFLTKYRDRIMFATDIVVTRNDFKTPEWIAGMFEGYIHMLEEEQFSLSLQHTGDFTGQGLYLDDETLGYIYERNFTRLFLAKEGTDSR